MTEFKVVLEETTKTLRLVGVPVPVEILTRHASDTREKEALPREIACTKPQYMSLKFAAQLLRIATGVKRVWKWTNIDTTSDLPSLSRGSWTYLNTALAFI